MSDEPFKLLDHLEEMHRSAMNYLHERPALDAVAMVTRVAFLLGEMRAPLRALRNELTKQAGEP